MKSLLILFVLLSTAVGEPHNLDDTQNEKRAIVDSLDERGIGDLLLGALNGLGGGASTGGGANVGALFKLGHPLASQTRLPDLKIRQQTVQILAQLQLEFLVC